jgi:hypothetical protein
MSLSFSNLFKAPENAASPFSAALNTKKSPSPLSFSPQAFSLTAPKVTTPTPSPTAPKTATVAVAQQPAQRTVAPAAPTNPGISEEQIRANLAAYTASQQQQPAPKQTQQNSPVGYAFTQSSAPEKSAEQIAAEEKEAEDKKFSQKAFLSQGLEKLTKAGEVEAEAGKLRQLLATQKQSIMANPNYAGSVKIGQSGIAEQNLGTQIQGLSAQQQALTSQGNAFMTGAQQAAPVQVPYGSQFVNPLTGQSMQPNGGGGNQNPQTQASTYAQEVASGRRSYDDAVSGMGLYGNVGKQFLDAAIRAVNPSFNFAQAQTLGNQQGAIGPNYQFANAALDNVKSALAKLGAAQTTNIPLLNAGANWVSTQTGIGSEATREMTGAVQSLRNAYASLLASAKGGTPTDYSAQAMAEIPNQPTPNDIAAIERNMQTLGQARVQTYGNPGTGGASSGGGLFSW